MKTFYGFLGKTAAFAGANVVWQKAVHWKTGGNVGFALRAGAVQAHPLRAVKEHVDHPRMKHKVQLVVCEVAEIRGACAQIRANGGSKGSARGIK